MLLAYWAVPIGFSCERTNTDCVYSEYYNENGVQSSVECNLAHKAIERCMKKKKNTMMLFANM